MAFPVLLHSPGLPLPKRGKDTDDHSEEEVKLCSLFLINPPFSIISPPACARVDVPVVPSSQGSVLLRFHGLGRLLEEFLRKMAHCGQFWLMAKVSRAPLAAGCVLMVS